MARRRFFVPSVRHGLAELDGEQARHLTRVLRVEKGRQFEISDNQRVWLGQVREARRDRVVFTCLEEIPVVAPPLDLHLFVSLIRFERLEWILEKATELGVAGFTLLEAARVEKGLEIAALRRMERWRRILLESSQQSRRAHLPVLSPPRALAEVLAFPGGLRYRLEENAGAPPLLTAIPPLPGRAAGMTASLLIGPEGGWTDHERELCEAAGWLPVSLGPLILRTETAALAAVAILQAAWQEAVSNGSAPETT